MGTKALNISKIVISLMFAMALAACSDAEFSSVDGSPSSNKANGLLDELPGPDLEQVPEEDSDDIADQYECHKSKKSCDKDEEELSESNYGASSYSSYGSKSGSSKKVEICHVPKGNPDARHEICISRNALKAHLDHVHSSSSYEGDHFGKCQD